MSTLVQWFNSLPDFIRRAIRTFLQGFLGTFIVALVGWLSAVQSYLQDGGAFPDPAVLASAGIAAFVGAVTATVTWAWNYAEDRGWVKSLLKQ